MGVGDVKSLIAEGTLDPELLEALLEADRLDHIAKRAQIDASSRAHNDDEAGVDGSGAGPESLAQQQQLQNSLVNGVPTEEFAGGRDDGEVTPAAAAGLRDDTNGDTGGEDGGGANGSSSSRFSKNGALDTARVIDVNENKVGSVQQAAWPVLSLITASLFLFLHYSLSSFLPIFLACVFRAAPRCTSPAWGFAPSSSPRSTTALRRSRRSSTTARATLCRRRSTGSTRAFSSTDKR